MATHRFCDWCDEKINEYDKYSLIKASSLDPRPSTEYAHEYEVCFRCRNKYIEFVKTLKPGPTKKGTDTK